MRSDEVAALQEERARKLAAKAALARRCAELKAAGTPINEIARRLRLHKNSVQKYLRQHLGG